MSIFTEKYERVSFKFDHSTAKYLKHDEKHFDIAVNDGYARAEITLSHAEALELRKMIDKQIKKFEEFDNFIDKDSKTLGHPSAGV